jgi:two-component system, NarL family, sensor histidine kinase DevS
LTLIETREFVAQGHSGYHWQAVFRPVLLPVAGLCLLLTLLTVFEILQVPGFSGRFENRDKAVVYVTPEGRYWSSPRITGRAPCRPTQIAIATGDVNPDVRLFDPAYNRAAAERQSQVRCLLTTGATISGVENGIEYTQYLGVRARSIVDIGISAWGLIAISLVAALVSGWVWSLRTGETATRLFAVNGFSFMVCFLIQAVFKSQGLGHDPSMLEAIYLVNELSNQVFFLSLLALFLLYPVRLLSGWRVWAVPAIFAVYVVLVTMMPSQTMNLSLGFTLLELLATIGLIGGQWWATRRRPGDRAALTWLALSVLVGAGLWVVALLVAERLGATAVLSEVYVVAMFFPFYLGLAMGVARFCLVELQDWAFRILFFVMAALLFAAVDMALVTLAGMAGGTALALALLAIAFLYLPLRDFLWQRFFKRRSMSRQDMFAAVMDIAFAPTPAQRRTRWETLVQRLFDPLKVERAEDVPDARILDDGLRLVLPSVADGPALSLAYARQGRELFSPTQVAMVRQLIALVRTAASGRDGYERGAAEERRRLAQDLHDDVGARLLTGLSVADDRTRPILQGALSDIRTIASGMVGKEAPLDTVMADIRHECVRRLEEAGVGVEWPLWAENAPLVLADYRLQKALTSALREIVSNVIRHSGAKYVEVDVSLDGAFLLCRIRDDGVGLTQAALAGESDGQGLSGLRRRLAGAGGTAQFANHAEGGLVTELRLPLTLDSERQLTTYRPS